MMTWSLSELGHQLFNWLVPVSIELAALALLVLAAGRLIRSPALRHLLWFAVLVKPLIAIAVSSPYTVFAPLALLAEPGWDAIPHGRVEHLAALAPGGATTAPTSAPLAPAGWAALLWLVGTSLLAGRILVGFGILRRMRRQALVQREGPLFEALRRAGAALHCHPRVEVATSPSIRSPMLLGILRLLIVVPTHVVERLSPGQLALVLMHELAHVRRYDNLALLVQRLVTAALFFHPAVWLCARMLRRESEQACDDLVVCATGRPEAYAHGLSLVAEGAALSNPPTRRIPVMSTFAATEPDLALRIRRTLGGGARRMGTRGRLLAATLLCPLAAVTMPSGGAADSGAASEPAPASVAADSSAADGTWREATAINPDEVLTLKELTERMRMGMRAVAEIDTEGMRRLVAVADSGEVTVKVYERRGRIEVVGRRKSDLEEALAQAIDQIEYIEREAIERVAAASSELTEKERLRKILEAVAQSHILRKAVGTVPDEWSEELKVQLLALKPDRTIEEIADFVRNVRSGNVVYGYSVRGKERRERENLFLVVDQDGNMKLMKDKPVTFATLGEELKKQRSLMDSTSMIIIQVDKRVTHAQIVKIMDIARQAGLVDQIIAETEASPTKPLPPSRSER